MKARIEACVSARETTGNGVRALVAALPPVVTRIEVYVDYLEGLNASQLRELFEIIHPRAMIVTFRRPRGENTRYSLADYEGVLQGLVSAKEKREQFFIDCDMSSEGNVAELVREHVGSQHLLLSHHDYETTPSANDLENLWSTMKASGAGMYKIATTAVDQGCIDRLTWLLKKSQLDGQRLVVTTMGPCGVTGRMALAVAGNPWTYCRVEGVEPTASGQPTVTQFLESLNALQWEQPV